MKRCLLLFAATMPTLSLALSPFAESFLRPGTSYKAESARPFTRLWGSMVQELNDLGDFDPSMDTDADGSKTRKVLETSLKVLERVVDSNDDPQLLEEVIGNDDGATKTAKSVKDPNKSRSFWNFLFRKRLEKKKVFSESEGDVDDKSILRGAIDLIKLLLDKDEYTKEKLEYITYPCHPEYPDVDLSSQMMKMLDGRPPLEYFFSIKKILRLLRHINRNRIGMKLRADNVRRAKSPSDRYRAFFTRNRLLWILPNPFNWVPLPKYVYNHWQEDKEVARQFLCGVNPVMICVVKNIDAQLSKPLVEHFGKDKLEYLQNEKRLLYVSYDDIAKILEKEYSKNPHLSYPPPMNDAPPSDQPRRQLEKRFFHAPIVLFELDETRQEMDILGIQLDRTDDAKVYTKHNTSSDEWTFVKACLTSADSQMHEWVSHLGKTHLTMEPHIIAIHNTLKQKKHPLYRYLKPICKDTLLLNWAARQTLAKFADNSFGDYMTSVGTGQFVQLISLYWSRYDFFNSSGLPHELEQRGFDQSFDMPNYFYREDGLELWDTYGKFATDFVNEVYSSDAAVRVDKDLQEWAQETVAPDRGAVPGFPSRFENKESVAKVLQTLSWMTGGLHAALNFPQYEFFAYVPNKPLHIRGDLPTKAEIGRITRHDLFNATMPSVPYAEETISTVHTLTFQTGHCIDNLDGEFDKGVGTRSYDDFKRRLAIIGKRIDRRNKWKRLRGKPVYRYLHPSEVPASIDI